MEVTKWLKPSECVSRIGDSASVQAATRVNAEQSSKRTMCSRPDNPFGKADTAGWTSEEYVQPLHRVVAQHVHKESAQTREAQGVIKDDQPDAVRTAGALGWRRVRITMKPDNAGEGRTSVQDERST